MKTAAIIVSCGCEEGETLTIVDILRRAEIQCDMVGLTELEVEGAWHNVIRCDKLIDESLSDYDLVILPGGYGGAEQMMSSELLLSQLKTREEKKQGIAAICAAPLVLDKAGVLEGHTFTSYPSVKDKIASGTYTEETTVVTDGNLITSRGPATAWAFAYALVDALGGDSETVKKRMVYANAFQEENR